MAQQRMRRDWQTFSVAPESTVIETMVAIDQGRLGLAVVVSGVGRLLGIVTDGDLRRAILRGVTLESPISEVMNQDFTAVGPEATPVQVLEFLHTRAIRHAPVLGASQTLVGVYHLPDLIGALKRPNWAVIMAGGEGRRLRPLTEKTPKPMLPVGGQPLLANLVTLIVNHGIQELFISVNFLAEQIEAYFGDGSAFGCRISYLRETQPLGTAGALGLLPEVPDDPLLVLNGDLLTDLNISALIDYHEDARCAATQCIREYNYRIPFGVVRCEADHVVEVEEKPLQRQLINAGVYMLNPQLLDLTAVNEPLTMVELLERARSSGHRVAAFPIRERWLDIGRPEDYEWAQQHWV